MTPGRKIVTLLFLFEESYVNVMVSKSKLYLQFLFNPIYGQFGAIWKPNSGRIVCKTYIFINSNLLSYKI